MSRVGLAVATVLLLGTARCPLGCRQRPRVQATTYGPETQIPVEPIDACRFRLMQELPRVEGVTGCDIDGYPGIRRIHWELDVDAGILTVLDKNYCSTDAGAHRVGLYFVEIVPVGGREYE